jgi:peptidoglycan/LPS O-acetylase OafA/YrhL
MRYEITAQRYRPDIDGLRAVAIIPVILFHAFPTVLGQGFLGVDVFFVISGFLITRLILGEMRDNKFTLASFFARRARRLLPALVTMLAGVFVAGCLLLLPSEAEALGKEILSGALFVSNFEYLFELGYFDRAAELKPLLHLWSLGVEEQFYVTWPLLLLFAVRRARLLAAVIATASFAAAVLVGRHHPAAAFFLPFTRFWELMVGATLASAPGMSSGPAWRSAAAVAGLGMVLFSFVGVAGEPLSAWRLLPTVGTGLLIFCGSDNLVSDILLSNKIAVGIGRISYPLYLWHWPLLSFLATHHRPDPVPASDRIIAIAASIGLAALTYWLIEKPVRFGRYRRHAVPALGAATAVLAILGLTEYGFGGLPFRFPEPIRGYIAFKYNPRAGARVNTCWFMAEAAPDAFRTVCHPAADSAGPVIWVWGDSHAGRLYVGISKELRGADVGELVRDGCSPIIGRGYPACAAGNDFIMSLILQSPPETLIMTAAWNIYEASFPIPDTADKLIATVTCVRNAGVKRVLVIGPVPQWTMDLPKVLYEEWAATGQVPERTTRRLAEGAFSADRRLKALLASTPSAQYISVIDALCNDQGCLTRVGPRPADMMAVDYGHLMTPSAQYLARLLPLR